MLAAHLGSPLPTILVEEQEKLFRVTRYAISDETEAEIGVASVLVDSYNRKDNFARIQLCVDHRQGYGSAIYAWAIGNALARDHDFVNDPNGNRNASLNTWRRLVRAGVAEQVRATPMGSEAVDIAPRNLGEFIVPRTLFSHTEVRGDR